MMRPDVMADSLPHSFALWRMSLSIRDDAGDFAGGSMTHNGPACPAADHRGHGEHGIARPAPNVTAAARHHQRRARRRGSPVTAGDRGLREDFVHYRPPKSPIGPNP